MYVCTAHFRSRRATRAVEATAVRQRRRKDRHHAQRRQPHTVRTRGQASPTAWAPRWACWTRRWTRGVAAPVACSWARSKAAERVVARPPTGTAKIIPNWGEPTGGDRERVQARTGLNTQQYTAIHSYILPDTATHAAIYKAIYKAI